MEINQLATLSILNIIQKLAGTQRQKEYIERILNGINHRIILIDRDYRILCLNKAALGKGADSEDAIGLYCYRIFEKRDSICVDCPAMDTFRTGEVIHIERLYHKGERNEIIYKISSYPVYDNKGKVVQAIVSSRDVTEIHRVEHIKNDLMKMLAHDIRNPVLATTQTIYNCLNSPIYKVKPSSLLHDVLNETHDNCELLLNMIDDILDIYRHEGNKFIINKKEVDLREAINSAVRLVGTLSRDKNIKIKLNLPRSIPYIIADENRLIRVIINLMENAIMYSPKNGRISVTVKFDDPSKTPGGCHCRVKRVKGDASNKVRFAPHIRINITDQGIGIPSEDLEKIFEKYYQVERKKTGSRIGLGLGLSFCRQTVEAHGGMIWAESPVYRGKGTRLVFALPVIEE
ncbi:MAG: hypothetical protein A2W23_08505 [Planctomycetes bacterium RBG_16_43_13]|nr:MAG: hypothetical protein A2W23_08505 [Planctomycetes bacterium RBG_16_43_13]